MPEDAQTSRLEDDDNPLPWFWLSFANEEGFLGVAIVQALTFERAAQRAWRLKINPGGEVRGAIMSPENMCQVPTTMRHRLLSKAELEETFGPREEENSNG